MVKVSPCTVISLAVLALIGVRIPGFLKYAESQNKFFEEVSVFTPDLENLEMRRMTAVEQDDKVYEILDPSTGILKETGWMKRDKDIIVNRQAIKADPERNWLSESTKVRHLTLMLTFSKQKITIYRILDIGINQIIVATHILKGKPDGNDALQSMADDMTIKEPAGIVYNDVQSVGFQPWNLTSAYENIHFVEKDGYDTSKYYKVMNLHEHNTHPFDLDLNFDIYVEHTDEALTLLTQQSEDGKDFIAQSSRLGLRSQGTHEYYAFRDRQKEEIETLTNIIVTTGAPKYGQGNNVNLHSAAYISDSEGNQHRFGFEFLSGLSGVPGLSNANKNAFTIDGKLYKLGVMDMFEGFDNKQNDQIEEVHIKARGSSETKDVTTNECDIWFTMKFRMQAHVPAVAIKVHEMYEQGYMSGWCYAGEDTNEKFYFTNIDALLIFDQNVL